ncbi:MAG: hypothetical protein ACM3RX_08585 [Methanococcaceae archaeon]
MKKLVFILIIVLLMPSCEKRIGTVIYKMKFTTDKIALSSKSGTYDVTNDKIAIKGSKSVPDNVYTQFGDYITSLTPTKFTANVWSLGYQDRVCVPGTNEANSLEYVNQEYNCTACLKPENHPDRYVDFSGNTEINVTPGFGGNINKERTAFQNEQVDFIYFYFIPYYLYQEVELPSQYAGVRIDMFQPDQQDSPVIEGNVLKVKHKQMLHKMYPNAHIWDRIHFIFGNCESTFVVNPNGEAVPLSDNNPTLNINESNLIIRSNKYHNAIYKKPSGEETVVMNGVLSFDTNGLIQVYAGADNIPYTSDDIFVYAPKFWERLSSSLEFN